MSEKIINLGVLAHVDAGKTTLTEQLLFQSGSLRKLGNVNKGTSTTDGLSIEKERGISVRSALACFIYNDVKVNLIDTPGHVDFCTEVERSLLALDAVVLVVSAVEGIQGHTLSLFHAIEKLSIPCLIFINKIDRIGSDFNQLFIEMKKELSDKVIVLQKLDHEASESVSVNPIWSNESIDSDELLEKIIEQDDRLLDKYLNGNDIANAQLKNTFHQLVTEQKLIPVLAGSAKMGLGIKQLLDSIVDILSTNRSLETKSLSAVLFKIEHDKTLGKLAYIRVFDGEIKPRETLIDYSISPALEQKVSQIKTLKNGKLVDLERITTGDIGIVSGLSQSYIGQVFGETNKSLKRISLTSPILTVQVKAKNDQDIIELSKALTQLAEEDPLLDLEWLADIRELHIKITGKIQIEILESLLKQRFDLEAEFLQPSVIYQETPLIESIGYECYWMPKPCWAILKLKIEPGERGSGVIYHSQVSVNDVAAKYQKEIEQTIPMALKQGIKGWPVTDLKITLIEGQDHNQHSRSGDFIIATPMAMMNGLVEAGTQLLEPILTFQISAPLESLSSVTSEITKMRGAFESPQIENHKYILKGTFPAATAMDFPVKLASISSGKAKITSHLSHYQPCTDEQGQARDYRGVSPLNRDKWILKARGAL